MAVTAYSSPTGLVTKPSATAYSAPTTLVSVSLSGFRTFVSNATRFKVSLHGSELAITFPYQAATQEIEWLLDEYLAEFAAF